MRFNITVSIIGVMSILLFTFLKKDDVAKAQITLQLLGLHKNNSSKFSKTKALFLQNDYLKINHLDSIGNTQKVLIENFYGDTLSDIFARTDKEWNGGCMPSSKRPNRKFEYLLFTEQSIVICFVTGGLGSCHHLEFFEIDSNYLNIVSSVSNPTNNLWTVALALRFDGNMIEFIDEEKNRKPVLLN